jgi:rhodanese-related sulfurtransferase
MRFRWLIFTVLWVACYSGLTAQATTTDPAYQKELKRLYKGTVPLIAPNQLAESLKSNPKLVILDTRSPSEYRVSHIQGAQLADYDHFSEKLVARIDRNQPVVVYCSVGYRSERIGEKLKQLGFKQVQNLYGGLFEWVNQGYPVVVTDNVVTDRVHTYNADWGKWLRKGQKVVD